jgi:hypothetical protein
MSLNALTVFLNDDSDFGQSSNVRPAADRVAGGLRGRRRDPGGDDQAEREEKDGGEAWHAHEKTPPSGVTGNLPADGPGGQGARPRTIG